MSWNFNPNFYSRLPEADFNLHFAAFLWRKYLVWLDGASVKNHVRVVKIVENKNTEEIQVAEMWTEKYFNKRPVLRWGLSRVQTLWSSLCQLLYRKDM